MEFVSAIIPKSERFRFDIIFDMETMRAMFGRTMVLAFLLLPALAAQADTKARPEIHAVWDHTGRGLYPGDWPKTFKILKEANVTDVFVNVAGPDFAHYASSIVPRSKAFSDYGDQLAACLRAAQGTGIRVHAWIICFNATRGVPKSLETFKARGWRMKDKDGVLTTYLNPANANVRSYALAIVDEVNSRYGVSGIHLDFVRWGHTVAKPADAAAQVTQFVAEARRRVKRPRQLTAAVYAKYPRCIETVGQDWVKWIDFNLVDYVVPMDYTESMTQFESFLGQHASPKWHAGRTIAGIGVTASESNLGADQVVEQIRLSRKHGLAGQSLFDLDATLERKILPVLRKGVWK